MKISIPLVTGLILGTFLVICVFSATRYGAAEEKPSSTNLLQKELAQGGPEQWEAALAGNNDARQTIATFLVERFKDEKEAPEKRQQAAFLLGKVATPEALVFLLQNITFQLPVDVTKSVPDRGKQYPCRYGLTYGAEWQKVPVILEYLKTAKTDEATCQFIDMATGISPGFREMLALLDVEYSRAKQVAHRKNVRTIMDYIIHYMSPADLKPEEQERQKLLEEKKITYGQINGKQSKSNNTASPADKPATP